jgi:outer membrane immunogenic protein
VNNTGFAGFNAQDTAVLDQMFPAGFGSSSSRDGFIGGLQAGYNQQFGMFVGGVEADINVLGNRRITTSLDSAASAPFGLPAGFVVVDTSSRLDWLGTLRLRGGVAIDRLLVYGTGGLAYGAPKNRIDVSIGPFLPSHTGSNDDVRAGWTLGTGAEYAVTNNLTMKAEYLYYDLGRTTVTATATNDYPLADTTATGRFDNRGHIARVGLNYKI